MATMYGVWEKISWRNNDAKGSEAEVLMVVGSIIYGIMRLYCIVINYKEALW